MILALKIECRCSRHNTLAAALRKDRNGEKCICAQAQALLADHKERRWSGKSDRQLPLTLVEAYKLGAPLKEIDPKCPAQRHNSETAARGYGKNAGVKCICAFGRWLVERKNDYQRAQSQRLRDLRKSPQVAKAVKAAKVLSLPRWWSGPWAIVPQCPASAHNSLNAAKEGDRVGVRCVCPHAQAELALYRERHRIALHRKAALARQREARRKARLRSQPDDRALDGGLNLEGTLVAMPTDLMTRSACGRAWNAKVAQAGLDTSMTPEGQRNRDAAREVCEECPLSVLRACRAWVLRAEEVPGSWPGVWGGLDPWQRSGRQLVLGKQGRYEAKPFTVGGLDDILQDA